MMTIIMDCTFDLREDVTYVILFILDDLKPPSYWSEMPSSEIVTLEKLAPSSKEHQDVETLMLSTADDKVTRIHKVSATQRVYI